MIFSRLFVVKSREISTLLNALFILLVVILVDFSSFLWSFLFLSSLLWSF